MEWHLGLDAHPASGTLAVSSQAGKRLTDFPIACGDGLDFDGGASRNGGESITAPDSQCVADPWRNQETPISTCGLGAELLVVLPLLGVAASRRRRAG